MLPPEVAVALSDLWLKCVILWKVKEWQEVLMRAGRIAVNVEIGEFESVRAPHIEDDERGVGSGRPG